MNKEDPEINEYSAIQWYFGVSYDEALKIYNEIDPTTLDVILTSYVIENMLYRRD